MTVVYTGAGDIERKFRYSRDDSSVWNKTATIRIERIYGQTHMLIADVGFVNFVQLIWMDSFLQTRHFLPCCDVTPVQIQLTSGILTAFIR